MKAQSCVLRADDGLVMSKDPVSPENLANLRRTLPGLGVGDGQPIPLQEVTAADVQSVLELAGQSAPPASVSSSSLPSVMEPSVRASSPALAAMRSASNPAMPMLRQTGSPAMPMLRQPSNPAMPMLRQTGNPAMPMLRQPSNPAMPMLRGVSSPSLPQLRVTGTSDPALGRSSSDVSIPSQPAPPNRLPLLIVGLGSLGVAIGVVAWLYPGQPTVAPKPRPVPKAAAQSVVREEGPQVAVPVHTVAGALPTEPNKPAIEKPASPEVTGRAAVKKPAEPAVATTSKPATTALPDKPVAKKVDPKPAKAVALDYSPVAQLTPQILRQHMTVAEPKWQGCPKDGSGKNLSIGIVVAPSGSVVKADVMGPSASTDTARCVTDKIRNMRFPAYAEGGPKTFFWSYLVP
ncbi:MAG: hypothetical protein JNM40_17640 [Myxococcales bacterium]|nr:hypothetical protein [Myxococcales bacterium]